MGTIDYQKIYDYNRRKWEGLTDEPEKYEALLAGHYSDSNHFIYELLQNAEDADATKVVIECYEDKLVFYHNGTPFNEDDVRGVSSMLMGTKSDRNSAQKIGHFGMGFKSVFKYTNIPEIYSDNEAFRIERYLLPVELKNGWNYFEEKKQVSCKVSGGTTKYPFYNEDHLTKFVIPFIKKNASGEEIMLSSDEVMKKLEDLDGRIQLFLTTIRDLYWVEKNTGKYAYISLTEAEDDSNLITCRLDSSELEEKEEISRFLKYKKVFEHKDMKYCNVSIAYRVNARANNINPLKDQCMWVYFPTKDEIKLPFLAHGSFETAVSREKLMEPSAFNDDLYEAQVELICASLKDLKNRGLITQAFIRQILIPSFQENRLKGLKEKVIEAFSGNAYLPGADGNYYKTDEVFIPIPFVMSDFISKKLFKSTFAPVKHFVSFNDNNSAGFQDYFLWLKDDLNVTTYTFEAWAKHLKELDYREPIRKKTSIYEELTDFYDFLSDHRESLHKTKRRSGSAWFTNLEGNYESILRKSVPEAWKLLKEAPVMLNMQGNLVPAYNDGKPNIYLNSSSKYKRLAASSLIDGEIAEKFKLLLEEGFDIARFDNFQFVKEKVIKKYVEGDDINFETEGDDEHDLEYIEDLKQIFALMDEVDDVNEVRQILKDAYVIRVIEDGKMLYSTPRNAYPPISEEGFDLDVYFEGLDVNEDRIEVDFYEKNNISIEQLKRLGIYSTLVDLGERHHVGSPGDPEWHALGEYCPYISVAYWRENTEYIQEHPDEDISKKKSALMLSWALKNSIKLAGRMKHNKTNVRIEDGDSQLLMWWIRGEKWLYNDKEELCETSDISKFELNRDVYGPVAYDKEAYDVLGFATKEQDETADAFDVVESMDTKQQELLLKQLARKYGYTLEKSDTYTDATSSSEELFNIDDVVSTEFPEKRVKNLDRLKAHVREQFFCADPTKYQQVLRQIRVSKDPKMAREYVSGMYTNDEGVRICQMCRKQAFTLEATEIANFGIEMEQLNLCLCPNCASKYKAYRDKDKNRFKDVVREALLDIWIDYEEDYEEDYILDLPDDEAVFFNQIHISEIQEILKLLDEYGLPNEYKAAEEDDGENVEEGPLGPIIRNRQIDASKEVAASNEIEEDSEVAREGEFISYKKKFANDEMYDTILQPNKYPLHKAFEGHKIGDVITFQGKQYEIIGL